MTRYAVLSYESSFNFGDEIQSIAAARLLPRTDLAIPREKLRDFSSEEQCVLLFNGWHSDSTQFPPAECITPIYIGFHIAESAAEYFTRPECIAHFRKHSPIGCRDIGTMEILRAAGVDVFYSKCLTLTLPKREKNAGGGIVFCDVGENKPMKEKRIRRILGEKNAAVRSVSHKHNADATGHAAKTEVANCLLSLYAAADLVVSSRLHCALPCVAMGVPVLYFGASEYRTAILSDIGITMHSPLTKAKMPWQRWAEKRRFRGFNWTGETPDIESEKAAIIAAVNDKLRAAAAKI